MRWAYLFSLSLTRHRMEWGGRRNSYSRNRLRNSAAPPSHQKKPRPTVSARAAPSPPILTSSLSPPCSLLLHPHRLLLCFSNSQGTVLPQGLCTDCSRSLRQSSSSITCMAPLNLCSNVTFWAREETPPCFNYYNPSAAPSPKPSASFFSMVLTTKESTFLVYLSPQ